MSPRASKVQSCCIVLLLASSVGAQTDTCRTFDTTAVVTVADTVKASELYARAKRWFASAFKDAQEVIQVDDPANATVVGKGVSSWPLGGWVHYTIEIACKDGRYKYTVKDIYHDDPGMTYSQYGTFPKPDLGTFYNCDVCCSAHAAHRREHPKQTAANAKNVKGCKKTVLPVIAADIHQTVASIRAGMSTQTTATRDW